MATNKNIKIRYVADGAEQSIIIPDVSEDFWVSLAKAEPEIYDRLETADIIMVEEVE